jgi:hypothetical protein
MNTPEIILLALLLFFMSIHVTSSMLICNFLAKRGEKLSFFLLRLKILSYASRYKTITKEESGQTGNLYYLWIISVNLALLSFVILIMFSLFPGLMDHITQMTGINIALIIQQIKLL